MDATKGNTTRMMLRGLRCEGVQADQGDATKEAQGVHRDQIMNKFPRLESRRRTTGGPIRRRGLFVSVRDSTKCIGLQEVRDAFVRAIERLLRNMQGAIDVGGLRKQGAESLPNCRTVTGPDDAVHMDLEIDDGACGIFPLAELLGVVVGAGVECDHRELDRATTV